MHRHTMPCTNSHRTWNTLNTAKNALLPLWFFPPSGPVLCDPLYIHLCDLSNSRYYCGRSREKIITTRKTTKRILSFGPAFRRTGPAKNGQTDSIVDAPVESSEIATGTGSCVSAQLEKSRVRSIPTRGRADNLRCLWSAEKLPWWSERRWRRAVRFNFRNCF